MGSREETRHAFPRGNPFSRARVYLAGIAIIRDYSQSALIADYLCSFCVETSDHSDIESRVRRLRDQLELRKREVKRLYNERKKQRKAMLRAQEASLRQELQVSAVLLIKTKTPLRLSSLFVPA